MVDPLAGSSTSTSNHNNVNSYCYQQPVSPSTRSWARTRSAFGLREEGPNMYPQSRTISWTRPTVSAGASPCRWPRPISNRMGDYFSGSMTGTTTSATSRTGAERSGSTENTRWPRARGSRTSVAPAPKARRTDNSARARARHHVHLLLGDSLARSDPDYDLTNSGDVGLVYKFTYGALIKPDIAQQEIAEQVGATRPT